MNQTLLTIATLAFLLNPAAARSENYLSIRAGAASMENFNQAYVVGLAFIHPLYPTIPHFSVEGEFLKSFSQMEAATVKRSFSKTSLYGVLSYPVEPRFTLKGKVGLHYAAFKDQTDTKTANTSDTGSEFGIGVLYALDRTRDLSAEYITSDANDFYQFLVGLQLRF